jgi:hypothetical protein
VHRPAADARLQAQVEVQQSGDPVADRQAEPEALLAPGRSTVEAPEFSEDQRAVLLRDPRPAVPDLHQQAWTPPAAADDDPATLRVAQRVRHEVLQHATQQHAIAADPGARAAHPQAKAAPRRARRELLLDVLHELVEREVRELGPHGAALEPCDV